MLIKNYTYGANRLGFEYDGKGNVADFDYDPWGAVSTEEELPFFGYNGEEYNPVTGLVYLRFRYYSPEMGAFIAEDDYLGTEDNLNSQNRYSYCEGDPVNYHDPTGHAKSIREREMQYGLDSTAQNFQNYANGQSYGLNLISDSTANSYIQRGADNAHAKNAAYNCESGENTQKAINGMAADINAAKDSANKKIQDNIDSANRNGGGGLSWIIKMILQWLQGGKGGGVGTVGSSKTLPELFTNLAAQSETELNKSSLWKKVLDKMAALMMKASNKLIEDNLLKFSTPIMKVMVPAVGGLSAYYQTKAGGKYITKHDREACNVLQKHRDMLKNSFSLKAQLSTPEVVTTFPNVAVKSSGKALNDESFVKASYNYLMSTLSAEVGVSSSVKLTQGAAHTLSTSVGISQSTNLNPPKLPQLRLPELNPLLKPAPVWIPEPALEKALRLWFENVKRQYGEMGEWMSQQLTYINWGEVIAVLAMVGGAIWAVVTFLGETAMKAGIV